MTMNIESLTKKIMQAASKLNADELYLFEADLVDAIDGALEDYDIKGKSNE